MYTRWGDLRFPREHGGAHAAKMMDLERFRLDRASCIDAPLVVVLSTPSPLSRSPAFEYRPRGCVVLSPDRVVLIVSYGVTVHNLQVT